MSFSLVTMALIIIGCEKSLDIGEDLCRRGRPNDAVPFLTIAMKDGNNFDAEIQMAYLSPDLLFSIEMLESAEKRARALLLNRLGEDCFDDGGPCVGRFWDASLLPTRPYMRVLQALVRMCFETKQCEKGARTIIEMLRLSPGDNLNQRWWLGPMLIRTGRFADALSFCQLWIKLSGSSSIPIRGGTVFKPPSDKLLVPETEAKYAKIAPCAMVHNAALAAFKLWGRCPQASQLLRIAARTNPDILAKIIGRRARPGEYRRVKVGAGDFNGPNEAHDYLWVAQDLWMAPDVWDWVNEDPAGAAILKSCSRPECDVKEAEATQFKRCAACRAVVYCGSTCQKGDWKRHKPECTRTVEERKIKKNAWKGKPPANTYAYDSEQLFESW
ncbi:hypothetical protein MSAN_02038000 [Mycena sanguinolenta]|uniref:MYND-type domain-containing protein n=1 Tax=Mycena sanguinolenta TaxID=230812 RepID=A0A8H6XIG4_9AGAR|nr:hypothetical protein MSAN_02038000 [Mycena sanguinolenta]